MEPYAMKTLYQSLLLALGALTLTGTSFAQVPSTNDTSDPTLHNTGGGTAAINNATTGDDNAAYGYAALSRNTSGQNNAAFGFEALYYNTTGSYNAVFGESAAFNNSTGSYNTASGYEALWKNAVGVENAAYGERALFSDRAGFNTAVGFQSLYENTTGKYNIALGWNAGRFVNGSNNIEIGNQGNESGDNDTIRIGTEGTQTATYIAGIVNGTSVTGPYVVIDSSTGQLGVSTTPPAGVKAAYVPRLLGEMRQQAAEIRDLKQQQVQMLAQVAELKTLNQATLTALQKLQDKDQILAQR